MNDEQANKKLKKLVRKQLEFYLSDTNLSKDRTMFSVYYDSIAIGGIPLDFFLNCNRIKKLVSTTSVIEEAILKSKVLQVVDGKVSRKLPFQHKSNQDECTVYVENIPPHASPEWCRKQLRDYGKVVYVAMPKFQGTERLKGYAFVEFDTAEEADNFVEVSKEAGWYITDRDPKELLTIKTYEGNQDSRDPESPSGDINDHALPRLDGKDEVNASNRIKLEPGDSEVTAKTIQAEDDENMSSYVSSFKVLSRKDWKKLRNAYLNSFKKEVIEQKKQIWRQKMKENRKRRAEREAAESRVEPPLKLQSEGPKFEKGLIVKIVAAEIIEDVKAVKEQVRALGGVKYVDVQPGANELHVRCEDPEAAVRLVKNPLGTGNVLTGAEELEYWQKVFLDRGAKYANTKTVEKTSKKKNSNKKKREHIRFDEEE